MTDEIRRRIEQVKNGGVPEGYQNKFGLSPIKWNEYKLSKLCKKRIQKNKCFEYNIVLSNTALHGVIRQSDYFEKGIANVENIDTYFVVKNKDFVYNPRISVFAPYGPIHSNKLGIDGIVSPLYTVFNLTSEKHVSYEYLDFYFETSLWNKYMYSVANFGARYDRMNIGDKDFFDLPICIPPSEEQKQIVEILAHCDRAIKLKKQLIDEECKQKRWLMEKLLNPDSGVRLPGFQGNWSFGSLSSLGRFSKGTGISNDDCSSGEIPCIKYGDIYMSYDVQFKKSVSYAEEAAVKGSPKVQSGTLLFTGSGEDRMEIGKCTAYMGTVPIAVGGDIIIMQVDCRKVNPVFLSYQQMTENLIKQKARIAQGYSIVHLYAEHIRRLQISLPPTTEEQTAIANILSTADSKIELLEQELEQWQQKKKSLMQLLLTGIVRVKI